ncbi:MAG TPA: tetratricopeptide repeat protein [Bryobacteraceae bacterium]
MKPLVVALLLLAANTSAQTGPQPRKQSIISELRAGKYGSAQNLLEQALKESPRDASLWTLRGFALSHLGKQKAALTAYKQAIEIAPTYLPALEGAAQIEYSTSDPHASALLKKILAIRPDDETSHAMLGALAFEHGDCKTATKEFRQSGQLIHSRVKPLEEYGSCLVRLRRPADAVPIFQRLQDLQPENNDARYNLGLVQLLAKHYQDAIATLAPLASKTPANADSLDLLGEAYEAAMDTPKAVATLRQAIVTDPDVPRYYLDFADLCMAHAAYQVGIDMVNAGLKRLPRSAQLYLARGILYIELGKYDQSDRDFAEAERLDPHLRYGGTVQGLAALQQNNLPHAEKIIRARLQKTPDDAFLHYLLGETLTKEGASAGSARFKEAFQSAQKAVQLQPDFARARDLLGRLLLEEGKTTEAIRQSRLAFQQDPTDQTALYHLILALRKGGRKSEILPLAKKLAKLREQARLKKAAEHKYALIEVHPAKKSEH